MLVGEISLLFNSFIMRRKLVILSTLGSSVIFVRRSFLRDIGTRIKWTFIKLHYHYKRSDLHEMGAFVTLRRPH